MTAVADYLTLPNGHRLHYQMQGEGPPLVLISGLGGQASFWNGVTPQLARRFTVVRHDHLGTGRSDAPLIDYSIEQMAADVVALMDMLNLQRAHVVGHSTGGCIAQTLALDYAARVDRLVLSATWARADPYLRLMYETRAEVLRRAGAALYHRVTALLTTPAAWLRDHGIAGDLTVSNPEIMLRRIDALLRFDRTADLPRLTAPTLVICARTDHVTPPYFSIALGALVPHARTVIIGVGGHFLPRISPRLWLRHVMPFLTEQRAELPRDGLSRPVTSG
jgi:aminoacrylate hydrolase